jgi:hypothetical protein
MRDIIINSREGREGKKIRNRRELRAWLKG